MTQDEIIRTARKAGFDDFAIGVRQENLERFAALVADHEREKAKAVFEELEREVKAELINAINGAVELEREACAKVCEQIERRKWEILTQGGKLEGLSPRDCAAAIRARSE